MRYIKELADNIMEEVEDAKKYAEKSLEHKAWDDSYAASRYHQLAEDELSHASFLHELVTKQIKKLGEVYTPPSCLQEEWGKMHKEFTEKAAWIKQMLNM